MTRVEEVAVESKHGRLFTEADMLTIAMGATDPDEILARLGRRPSEPSEPVVAICTCIRVNGLDIPNPGCGAHGDGSTVVSVNLLDGFTVSVRDA